MRIHCLGGGPAGLYFAILLKKRRPEAEVCVWERNRPEDTFGFGVVFSDATMDNLEAADPESWHAVRQAFYRWDDIHIHYRGELLESTGHGFAGCPASASSRSSLRRAKELGADLRFGSEIADPRELADADLVIAGDGVHSPTRELFAEHFEPDVDMRPNRFVWLGTTCPFPAFTFYFRENEHGLWRIHAYQYEPRHADPDDREPISTFIVETTDEAFEASGLGVEDEAATVAYCEELFAENSAATGSSPTSRSGASSRPSATGTGATTTSSWSVTPPTRPTSPWAPAPSWRWKTSSRWSSTSTRPGRRHGRAGT